MYHVLEARVRTALAAHIRKSYGQDVAVVTERPPRVDMGEIATPGCFELAKRLKRAPRQIAQEIATQLPQIEGVERVEVAGGGYVNLYLARTTFLAATVKGAEFAPVCNLVAMNCRRRKRWDAHGDIFGAFWR